MVQVQTDAGLTGNQDGGILYPNAVTAVQTVGTRGSTDRGLKGTGLRVGQRMVSAMDWDKAWDWVASDPVHTMNSVKGSGSGLTRRALYAQTYIRTVSCHKVNPAGESACGAPQAGNHKAIHCCMPALLATELEQPVSLGSASCLQHVQSTTTGLKLLQ